MRHDFIKVELGCGKSKTEGYIGVDRFKLPGVDIVADLNKPFPFEDNYVDILYACHSLEHLDDMKHIMSEIFRISKHMSIIYILAPYSHTSLNEANFYHKLCFNEDTFRLFSNEEDSLIDKEEYYCPHSYQWGLQRSDNSSSEMEFKLFEMEFFYYKEYLGLSDIEKLHARRTFFNVCDQIYYALVINKSGKELNETEIQELKDKIKINEPPLINALRARDSIIIDAKSIYTDIDDKIEHHLFNTKQEIKKLDNDLCEFKIENDEKIVSYLDQSKVNYSAIETEIKSLYDYVNEERFCNEINHKTNNLADYLNHKTDSVANHLNEMKNIINNLNAKLEDNDNKINRIYSITTNNSSENNSSMILLLDLLKIHDNKNLQKKLYIYNKKINMFNLIQNIHTNFMEKLVLINNDFSKNSLITVSNLVPYDSYFEYKISGVGDNIHMFFFANYGSSLIIELVKNGTIIFQQHLIIQVEGEQIINHSNLEGDVYIRFRTLDNRSIVRILEITNRRKLFFTNKTIAGYIE